jgi:hypothetical protein
MFKRWDGNDLEKDIFEIREIKELKRIFAKRTNEMLIDILKFPISVQSF